MIGKMLGWSYCLVAAAALCPHDRSGRAEAGSDAELRWPIPHPLPFPSPPTRRHRPLPFAPGRGGAGAREQHRHRGPAPRAAGLAAEAGQPACEGLLRSAPSPLYLSRSSSSRQASDFFSGAPPRSIPTVDIFQLRRDPAWLPTGGSLRVDFLNNPKTTTNSAFSNLQSLELVGASTCARRSPLLR